MGPKFICPFWGSEQKHSGFVDRVANSGYQGIEINVPSGKLGQNLVNEIKANKLIFIAQQWLPQSKESFSEYLNNFMANCLRLAELNPVFINSHSDKDYFSFDENCRIIDSANQITEKTSVKIHHEIHRGRFTFHPYYIQKYLKRYPGLTLTADYSHWCTVCESMLEDQQEALTKILPHVKYIHARIGFEQGPQINDPQAPEWSYAVDQHIKWWDEIVAYQKQADKQILICPELGPVPYMPTEPFTKKPLVNQWQTNLWIKNLLSERYSNQKT